MLWGSPFVLIRQSNQFSFTILAGKVCELKYVKEGQINASYSIFHLYCYLLTKWNRSQDRSKVVGAAYSHADMLKFESM